MFTSQLLSFFIWILLDIFNNKLSHYNSGCIFEIPSSYKHFSDSVTSVHHTGDWWFLHTLIGQFNVISELHSSLYEQAKRQNRSTRV